jgi:pimeloyl-ACP methyl ester carboxylesterase
MKTITSLILCVLSLCVSAQPVGKFFDDKGMKIYYEESGKGEPLILLHTFTGRCGQWSPYIEEFSKHYHVIAVDMVGHGKSDPFPGGTLDFKHADYAKIVLSLMDNLNLAKVSAIGASSGGMTLLYANLYQPDRFKSVIVIGAQVYMAQQVREWIAKDGPNPANAALMADLTKAHGADKALLIARQFQHFTDVYGDPAITPDMMNSFKANWLIVHGDNDFVPYQQAIEMQNSIPNARLWIFPNGGHLPHLIPANYQEFKTKLMDFLRGTWDKK